MQEKGGRWDCKPQPLTRHETARGEPKAPDNPAQRQDLEGRCRVILK